MKTWRRAMWAATVALAAAGCRATAPFSAERRQSLAGSIIAGWTEPSRLQAARLIELYGPPDALAAGGLGWKDNGNWKRTLLLDASPAYVAEQGTRDSLEQTVGYRVPEGGREALAAFSAAVRVSEDGDELTARSSDESLNFLVLNLADEVARGAREPVEARRFYRSTVELAGAGKSSPYLRGLMFPVQP